MMLGSYQVPITVIFSVFYLAQQRYADALLSKAGIDIDLLPMVGKEVGIDWVVTGT